MIQPTPYSSCALSIYLFSSFLAANQIDEKKEESNQKFLAIIACDGKKEETWWELSWFFRISNQATGKRVGRVCVCGVVIMFAFFLL